MSIMDSIAEQQGWNTETQLDLALQYIANQGSDDAFDDFLQQRADEENAESAEEEDEDEDEEDTKEEEE